MNISSNKQCGILPAFKAWGDSHLDDATVSNIFATVQIEDEAETELGHGDIRMRESGGYRTVTLDFEYLIEFPYRNFDQRFQSFLYEDNILCITNNFSRPFSYTIRLSQGSYPPTATTPSETVPGN